MTSRTPSLKKQLLLWISVPVFIAGLATVVLAFAFSWFEVEEVYDAQLVHSAKVLLQLTEHEILENGQVNIGTENPNLQHKYEKKTAFRIWHQDELVTQSSNAVTFGAFQAPPGFSDQTINGKPWRFFVFLDPANEMRVETSERYAIRYELIWQLMTSLIAPVAFFIPVIFIIVWLGVRKSLFPLNRVSRAVDKRDADDLTPIESRDIPAEVMPLTEALNRLLARIADSFRREREFTDHAAHELRTPLAAMKTQTQVLMKKAEQIPDCQEGLENLNASIDRASHMVSQLLAFARLQNETLSLTKTNLSVCIRDVIADLTPLTRVKTQTIDTAIPDNIFVNGHADSLAVMVRNLLDNALKYAPRGSAIKVTLSKEGRLEIRDTGPGLSDMDKARVFGRFVRADKTGQAGSGLGLAIVKWVADAHKAQVALSDNDPHGLVATVSFPESALL